MRFAIEDGRSARRRRVAWGIAVMVLALAGMPAAAQTEAQTEATHTAVHSAHPLRHHPHPTRTLARTQSSRTESRPSAAGQTESAKTTKPAETTSPGAAGSTAATTSKGETPAPAEVKPSTQAKSETPAPTPAEPATAKPPTQTKSAPPPPAPAEPTIATSLLDPKVAQGYVGQAVYGRKGEKLGDLSAVTTGPDGKVKSATITWGGWFGYFQSRRTIDWPATDPTLKDGKLMLGAITRQQLRNGEQPQASR